MHNNHCIIKLVIAHMIMMLASIPITLSLPLHDPGSPPQDAQNVGKTKNSCSIFRNYGKNDLSVNDIVVKSDENDVACIKARFALAIKVEEALIDAIEGEATTSQPDQGLNETRKADGRRLTLGYLPLDSVVKVEQSCPPVEGVPKNQTDGDTKASDAPDPHELEMIVTFECGKLAFNFRQDNDNIHVSSITGVVNLDSNVVREFISDKPVFFTSDLNHHYKYDDLVEVGSKAKTKVFILTANFYHTEFEAFRTTTSRDFVKPPDDNSKPFIELTN